MTLLNTLISKPLPDPIVRGLIIVLVLLVVGGGYYLTTQNLNLKEEVDLWMAKHEELSGQYSSVNSQLMAERARNDEFSEQIGDITSTVEDLEKLKKIDPELLRKYSKVYFLSENYIPSGLRTVDKRYVYQPAEEEQVHTKVWPYLKNMLEEAEDDKVTLQIVSAYRSFFDQYTLKTNYKVTYGQGANQFSADQGYSEHQLGAAIDLTTPTAAPTTLVFEKTEAYTWLVKNGYKYGFVLSYPPNNTYYQYEPWHWRFVGVKLATKLHHDDKYFYDLDQREINEYLINLFD